ncbi:hypothetical protein JCM16303_006849 [Sporobolomyces ruberrimus]
MSALKMQLDEELYEFVECVRPTHESHRDRMRSVRRFESILRTSWPASKVEVFGSLATGLYLPDGDLDVVISVPSLSNVPTEDVFADIARVVRSFNFADPGSLELLSHARVPLLKFQSLPDFGSYQFDVSLEHARDGPLGAIACLAILDKLDEVRVGRSDRVKGLVFAIKTLLQSKGLGSARDGSLGGMSIFCLVVSFVQHDKRLERDCSPGTDLLAFLEWAASFDYERMAISVVGRGSIRPKSTQSWTRNSKRRRVCIQHPTDLGELRPS